MFSGTGAGAAMCSTSLAGSAQRGCSRGPARGAHVGANGLFRTRGAGAARALKWCNSGPATRVRGRQGRAGRPAARRWHTTCALPALPPWRRAGPAIRQETCIACTVRPRQPPRPHPWRLVVERHEVGEGWCRPCCNSGVATDKTVCRDKLRVEGSLAGTRNRPEFSHRCGGTCPAGWRGVRKCRGGQCC